MPANLENSAVATGLERKDWCWSWNSSTLATSCEVLTHWKRPWCWEGLGAGGEGDDRGWDGWMANADKGRKLMDMNRRLERYIGTMWGKALYLYIGFWSLTTVGDNKDIIRFAFWKDYFGYLCEIWIFPFSCKEASYLSSLFALISVFQNKIKRSLKH